MLSQLRLRSKVLLLALGPICLLTLLLSGIAMVVLDNLADEQEAQTRTRLVEVRKTELKHYVDLAMNAIAPLYEASAEGDMEARARAVEVLKRLAYGSEGYFWGYDAQVRRVFQGNTNDRIGADFTQFQDAQGRYAIRDLVRAGLDGSHYVEYSFVMADGKQLVPKIGYSLYLSKWKLIFGTAVNLDGVERDVQLAREEFKRTTDRLLMVMVGSAVGLALVLTLLALPLAASIARPVRLIKANLDDMAAGDGNLTIACRSPAATSWASCRCPSTASWRRSTVWFSRSPAPPAVCPGWSAPWPARRSVPSRPWSSSVTRPTRSPPPSTRCPPPPTKWRRAPSALPKPPAKPTPKTCRPSAWSTRAWKPSTTW